jgi:hypothetical protein
MIARKSNRFVMPWRALTNQMGHSTNMAFRGRTAQSLKTGVQSQISRVLLGYEVYTTPAGK